MEVQHRRTYERLGLHDHLEGFEHWKDMKIQNKKKREVGKKLDQGWNCCQIKKKLEEKVGKQQEKS